MPKQTPGAKDQARDVACRVCDGWYNRKSTMRKHFMGQHFDSVGIRRKMKLDDIVLYLFKQFCTEFQQYKYILVRS